MLFDRRYKNGQPALREIKRCSAETSFIQLREWMTIGRRVSKDQHGQWDKLATQ
jgi:hypothetical protein